MDPVASDVGFVGDVPQVYERFLVPLIFASYAADLARRAAEVVHHPARVLEVAAGTGVLTRALAGALPADVAVVATDLQPEMLATAAAVGTARPVMWGVADALRLPFPDASFDLVACQFATMFFPDRPRAYAEARRVLRPGGRFLFNVWDRIETNEFAEAVTDALAARFPDDPPRFLARTPHGYHDPAVVAADLARAGFPRPPEVVTLPARSRAESPRIPAIAYCQGTPLRGELEARAPGRLAELTELAAEAIARRFGDGPVDGLIQAHVIAVDA